MPESLAQHVIVHGAGVDGIGTVELYEQGRLQKIILLLGWD